MLSNSLQGIYDDFGDRNFTTLATGFGFYDGGRKLEPFVFLAAIVTSLGKSVIQEFSVMLIGLLDGSLLRSSFFVLPEQYFDTIHLILRLNSKNISLPYSPKSNLFLNGLIRLMSI